MNDFTIDMNEVVSTSDSQSLNEEQAKANMLPFKIMCFVLIVLVTLGWVGMIVLLIMKEEWQLVLVAWLLLYAALHFCYWYCRRDSSRDMRDEFIARIRGTDTVTRQAEGDNPPSYDDLVKSEVPPPTYYSVVDESPRLQRFSKIKNIGLPWFLKKKALESQSRKPSSDGDNSTVTVGPALEGAASSTAEATFQNDESSRKSSTADDEPAVELPSYETLIRENMQPVFTPIHQALSRLPTPPPPYSPRRMQTIAEDQQDE